MIVVIIVVVAAEVPVQGQTRITCDRCKMFDRYYATPGRAKMGLASHQKSCK